MLRTTSRFLRCGSLFTFATLLGCTTGSGESVDVVAGKLGSGSGPATDLGTYEEQCRPEGPAKEWGTWACDGVDGYELVVGEGTARERVFVRHAGTLFDLELLNRLPEPGRAGPKAEWRRTSTPGELALVFRYSQPTSTEPKRSSLVVAKVTPSASCIHAVVDGGARDQARFEAASDGFRDLVCAPSRPSPVLPDECGTLRANTGIAPDTGLVSCGGAYQLTMQQDGNLVLYRLSDMNALWNSRTNGARAATARLGLDGSFMLFDDTWNPNPVWSAGTTGHVNAVLRVQDDGNVVLYDASNHPVWATNTVE